MVNNTLVVMDTLYNLVRKVIERMEQAGCWLCERDTSEEDTAKL
jgi:hypothetical protein